MILSISHLPKLNKKNNPLKFFQYEYENLLQTHLHQNLFNNNYFKYLLVTVDCSDLAVVYHLNDPNAWLHPIDQELILPFQPFLLELDVLGYIHSNSSFKNATAIDWIDFWVGNLWLSQNIKQWNQLKTTELGNKWCSKVGYIRELAWFINVTIN